MEERRHPVTLDFYGPQSWIQRVKIILRYQKEYLATQNIKGIKSKCRNVIVLFVYFASVHYSKKAGRAMHNYSNVRRFGARFGIVINLDLLPPKKIRKKIYAKQMKASEEVDKIRSRAPNARFPLGPIPTKGNSDD